MGLVYGFNISIVKFILSADWRIRAVIGYRLIVNGSASGV
jgi:hypothetical protein